MTRDDELLERFLNLDGNYDMDELENLQSDLKLHLQHLQNEKNILLSHIHKTVESLISDNLTDDIKLSYAKINETLKYLSEKKESWDLYEIKIVMFTCSYMDNFEEAYLLTQTALKQLDNFVEHSRYSRIKMSLHMNLASRLLEAKYFDPHYIKQSKEIEELFNEQVEPSLSLCIENNWLDAFAVCLIRKGIFLNSNIEIYAGEKLLHLTNNLELIRLLKKDIEKYLHKGGNSNGNFN